MPILVVFKINGGTLAQYDQATTELFGSLTPAKEDLPDGLLSHVVAQIEGGVKVIDVWETKEQFEEFGKKLLPALQRANAPQAEPKILEVHNFLKS